MRILAVKPKRLFSTLAFDGSARLAGGGGCGQTVVWDVVSGAVLDRLDHRISFDSQSLHFRNGHLLVPTADGLVACDPAAGADRTVLAGDWFVTCVALDAAGDWGVLQHNGGTGSSWLMSFARAGGPRQKEGWSVCLNEPRRWKGDAVALAVLPGGKRFLAAEFLDSPDEHVPPTRVTVRARSDGRVVAEQPGVWDHGERVFASPWSHTFVVAGGPRLQAYDARDLDAPPVEVLNDGKKHFTAAAFHPSGNYLLVTSNNATVKLYDARTWAVVRSFTWDIGRLRSAAFSPDGTLAAVGGEVGQVVVWDVDV